MTQICKFYKYKSTKVQNEFRIAKFKNPDIDNQMSRTCG